VFVNENLLYFESPGAAEELVTFVAVAQRWELIEPLIPFEPAVPTLVNAVPVPVTPDATTALALLSKFHVLKSAALAE